MNTSRLFITLFCMIASVSGFANDPVSSEIDKSVWNRVSQSVVDNDIFGMATDASGTEQVSLVEFEALLVKMDGQWKILMERQVRETDEADWSSI